MMAPLFTAFDRDYHERIIPYHLADVERFPAEVLECLKSGCFTASITGKPFHSVALDEVHEMCVNKDLKAAVTRPTKSYLQKTTLFFNYHIKAFIVNELFPEKNTSHSYNPNILNSTPQARRIEDNIHMRDNNLLTVIPATNRGIINVFSGQKATPEQQNDMLNFRSIGTQAYLDYVNHNILHTPSSTKAPLRCHRLLTMKSTRQCAKRSNPKEKEQRQVIKCLHRKLAWYNHSNVRQ